MLVITCATPSDPLAKVATILPEGSQQILETESSTCSDQISFLRNFTIKCFKDNNNRFSTFSNGHFKQEMGISILL